MIVSKVLARQQSVKRHLVQMTSCQIVSQKLKLEVVATASNKNGVKIKNQRHNYQKTKNLGQKKSTRRSQETQNEVFKAN